MRRDQIKASLASINGALSDLSYEEVIGQLRGRAGVDSKADASYLFVKYSAYMEYYNSASTVQKDIIKAYGLDELADPSFWAALINKDEARHSNFYEVNYNISTLMRSAEKLSFLLDRKSDGFSETLEGLNPSGKVETIKVDRISILLRENDIPDIKVGDLISILNDIKTLYDIIINIYGFPHADLIVGSIDSGSDKSIDIIGIAEAVSKLSNLILEGWDRVRFNKEQKLEKSFKSVSEGIDILDKIKNSQENASISAEEAEKLRRTVVRSMENLISSGVYTPETETRSPTKPSEVPFERKLMITYQDKEKINTRSGARGASPASAGSPAREKSVKKKLTPEK